MSKLLEQINTAEKINLGSVAHYVTDKINISDISVDNYISTENMLPDRGGVVQASKLPTSGKVTKFEFGDTLTSNIRPYFKKIWQATKDGGCSNDVLVIRPNNKNKLDENFLYYNISNDIFFAYSMMSSQGTKMPRGDKEAILKYEISFPNLPTQKKIAEILGAYDEKIENNNKIIKNLETTAQAIFNEWFVKFRFPGYEKAKMVDSEMGEIPEGWGVKKLEEVFDISIGRTPPRQEHQWFSKNPKDVKWVSIKDMGASGIYIHNTDEYLTKEAVNKFNIPLIPKNTLIVSFKLTIGRLAITTEEMLSNEAIAHFKNKSNLISVDYAYLFLKKYNFDSLGSTSSIANAVNSKSIKGIKILVPEMKIMQNFKEIVRSLFQKILITQEENISLKSQRDQLLVKLI